MSLNGSRPRNYHRPAVPLHMEPSASRASLSPPRTSPSTLNLPRRRHSSASCIPKANASIASSPDTQPSPPVGAVEGDTKLLPQSRSAEDLMLYNASTKMSKPIWHNEKHTLPSRAISAPGHLPRQPIINSLLSRIRATSPNNFQQLITLKSAYNAAFVDEYGTSDPIPYPEAMNQAPKHNLPRRRPTRWICQCFNYVTENCHWGASCKYGHKGDRYLDNPDVVQQFKDGRCITPLKVPKATREGNNSNKSGVDPVKASEPVVPSGQSAKTHFKKAVKQNRHTENSRAQDGKAPTVAAESAGGAKVTDTANAHEVKAKETESTGGAKHSKESPKNADKQQHESGTRRDTPKLTSSAGNSAGKRPKRKNNHRGPRQGARTSDATAIAQSQDVKPQTDAVVNKGGNKANVSETKPVQTGSSKEPDSVGDKLVKKEDANKPGDPTSNTPAVKKELQHPKPSYKTVLVQGVKIPKLPVQTNDKEVASDIIPKAVEPQVPVVANTQTIHQNVEKPVQVKEKDISKTPSVPATAERSNEEFPSPMETKEPAPDSSSPKSLNPDAVEFVPVATDVIHSQPHTGPYSLQEPNVMQSTIPQPGHLLPELLHPQPRLPIVFGTAPYIEVNRTKIVSPGGRVYLGFMDSYGRPLKMSPEIMDKMTTMPQFIGPPGEPGVVHSFPEPGPGFMRTVAPNDQVSWISTPTPGNGPGIAPTQASPSSEEPPMFRHPILSRDGRGRNHNGHGHDRHNSSHHVIGFQPSRQPNGPSFPQPQYQTPQMEYASEAQNNGGYMQMQAPPDDQQFSVGGYKYPHIGDAYNCGFEYPAAQGFAPSFQGYHCPPQDWYPQLPVAPVFMPQGMTDGQPEGYYDPEGW